MVKIRNVFANEKKVICHLRKECDAVGLLKKFKHLQEQRVLTYRLFDDVQQKFTKTFIHSAKVSLEVLERLTQRKPGKYVVVTCITPTALGFKAYISTAPNYDFVSYRQLVHDVTETFKSLSVDVINIHQKLSASSQLNAVAKCIGSIQTLEQSKLELTAKLQIAMQSLRDTPQNTEIISLLEELSQRISQIETEIFDLMEEIKYETEDLIQPLL